MSIIQHLFFDLLGSLATIALWGIKGINHMFGVNLQGPRRFS